jgi:4-aminobutyrate aminotransferase and related aminotransferases
MLALELVEPNTLDADPALLAAVTTACHQAGLITLTAGAYGTCRTTVRR